MTGDLQRRLVDEASNSLAKLFTMAGSCFAAAQHQAIVQAVLYEMSRDLDRIRQIESLCFHAHRDGQLALDQIEEIKKWQPPSEPTGS